MYNIYVWHSDLVTFHSTAGSDDNNFILGEQRLRAYSWMLGWRWGFINSSSTSHRELSGEQYGSRYGRKIVSPDGLWPLQTNIFATIHPWQQVFQFKGFRDGPWPHCELSQMLRQRALKLRLLETTLRLEDEETGHRTSAAGLWPSSSSPTSPT